MSGENNKGLFTLIKEYCIKYKELITYVFFGGCTTVIDWGVYYLFHNQMGVSNVTSNIISWFIAVLFALITNKIWVFEARDFSLKAWLREGVSFFAARAATGAVTVAFMWITVDILGFHDMLMKILSSVVSLVLNYIASKIWIFAKKKGESSIPDEERKNTRL